MNTTIKSICITMLVLVVCIAGVVIQDKANHYSVPAEVIGLDYDGYTLFETKDGNIWAYELKDHLDKGTEVKLNMLDNSPDGKTVKYNTILSIELDGVTVETE